MRNLCLYFDVNNQTGWNDKAKPNISECTVLAGYGVVELNMTISAVPISGEQPP